ncbi:MAG: ATP-dependent helicase, partial [bacterium]
MEEKILSQEEILANLNDRQREATVATKGPVLILAGAGSGKTRVLVHRIAYMINVENVSPGNILAITFTNKAADEMRSRVNDMVGFRAGEIWVMTFHAFCVRVLRRHAEELGFNRYFSIYDTDDQLRLMKDIFRRREINPKSLSEKSVLREISKQKNENITAETFAAKNQWSEYYRRVAELYGDYQERLKEANAMDFDDLLMHTVTLFAKYPEILELYQERFRYLMVDEYQDTNNVQFRLVKLLSAKYRNLCVVGDDDQSIYKFRGADIKNILSFEDTFPDAKVVRLEQNYRSTQNILDAANAVISNNGHRKEKRLWTDAGQGPKIRLKQFDKSFEEAAFVVGEIRQMVASGQRRYRDFAVLYRTNAQSRAFEEQMIRKSVPYRLVGGINFYSRKEIKDLLAYLKLIDNPADDISAQRIINVPRRGIGDTTVRALSLSAEEQGISFYRAALLVGENRDLKPASAKKVVGFTALIEGFREEAKERGVDGLLNLV